MKLENLFEATKKLSKIDAGYEWVLRNGCSQDTGLDRKPKILWGVYTDGKVKGKKFFDENLAFIQESLYWTRDNYSNLTITDDIIDFGGNSMNSMTNVTINPQSGPPPMKLKGIGSVEIVGLNVDALPDWLPEKCKTIGFDRCPNLTFSGAGSAVKECRVIVIRHPAGLGFKGGILGLFKIKGIERFMYAQESFDRNRDKFSEIINEGIKSGDVFDCQEKLIANGFKAQAAV